MVEQVDRRVLGAIRLLDGATSTPVRRAMRVEGDGLTLLRNRSAHYVIVAAAGLEAHTDAFAAPPAVPPAESLPFVVRVTDPERAYLPALAAIALPRPFDPNNDVRDLMVPVDIALASSAGRAVPLAWAALRVRVTDTAQAPLRGALVEALPLDGGDRLGWGITNDRGETLVPVPGLRALQEIENDPDDPDDNQIVTAETRVNLRVTADPERPWPVNPDVLAAGEGSLRRATEGPVSISPGRTVTATLTLDLS